MTARIWGAEGLGTGILVATVVGSGIMGQTLTENVAVALLVNAVATAAMLAVLITLLGPVSGAQFNPCVTLVLWATGTLPGARVAGLIAAQLAGAVAGTLLAHAMFDRALITLSDHARTGPAQWLSEMVATAMLIFVILSGQRHRPAALPTLVALSILAMYLWTASTSFANPAVTLARALTDTFSGIRPGDVPAFVLAQLVGAGLGLGLFRLVQGADSQS